MRHIDLSHTHDGEDDEDDESTCIPCLAKQEVHSACRCGGCCRSLIIEVLMEDAEVEPRIKEKGSPLLDPPDENGRREPIGYLLNSPANGGACAFLDRETNLCGIYATRPLLCRLFNCDGEERDNMIQLGILPPRE